MVVNYIEFCEGVLKIFQFYEKVFGGYDEFVMICMDILKGDGLVLMVNDV